MMIHHLDWMDRHPSGSRLTPTVHWGPHAGGSSHVHRARHQVYLHKNNNIVFNQEGKELQSGECVQVFESLKVLILV